MKCKHDNIRVYQERAFTGTIDDAGTVHYNTSEPEHDEITAITCIECDHEFNDGTDAADEPQTNQATGRATKPRPLYRVIAATLQARNNCQAALAACPRHCADQGPEGEPTCSTCASRADWHDRYQEKLDAIAREMLPSGSGIDSGTTIDPASTPERVILRTSYHHMNDAGFYDGWTDHAVIITPSLADGYTLHVTGRDRNQIKEYLADTFTAAMEQPYINL
jgi:hypothetical protein